MSGVRPQVLLFDLGGVLVENDTFAGLAHLLQAAGQPVEEEATLAERWLHSPSVRAFELGRLSAADFAAAMVEEWRLAIAPTDFLVHFTAWPKGLYAGADELLQDLRKHYRLACLSNCNVVHWPRFLPWLGSLQAHFSSHLLGVIKPDAAAFAAVLAALAVAPEAVLFFDDAPANVAAARRCGLRAECVRGLPELHAFLAAHPALLPA